MRNCCLELSACGEKAFRVFLDILKQELDCLGIVDISSIQAFILMNVNDNVITMGEVLSRGYYVGSNASYNVKKMISNGYMKQNPSEYDKRASYLSLTDKGLELCQKLENAVNQHMSRFEATISGKQELERGLKFMKKIESYWQDILTRRI
ncbi:MAG: MarR family winged helix-turn-helix transcriptional regulator [Holosporales bacterium]|jgi:DNA-binding MarR family transcriptional regulator|nr:MarR family winged helix-turn-helix transcriptional regulator [Holosporales bacterium]